jgi:hypothetical protein
MEPSSLSFACVIEPYDNWLNGAAILIGSVRERGGPFATSAFHLFVAGTSTRVITTYECLNVVLWEVRRDDVLPHLNKAVALRQLAAHHPQSEYVLLLDHDTVVLDLADLPFLLTPTVKARRSFKYGLERWLGGDYVDRLGISPAAWKRIPYLNSGVVLTPTCHARTLATGWRSGAHALVARYGAIHVVEQLGLSVSLALSGIPMEELPTRYNQNNWRSPSPDARIVHYNGFDATCREVKAKTLHSLDDFLAFLAAPVDAFWRMYAERLASIVESRAFAVRETIAVRWPFSPPGPPLRA